jgi:hypothetical protein
MTREDRRIVEGFKLPSYAPPTQNESAWISMLRAIVGDSDPVPTLAAVQSLRQALMR